MHASKKPDHAKKVWVAPSLELIEVKSKSNSKILPGFYLLDPHDS